MLNLAYEYKLEPTEAQVAVFEQWLEICRKVYNFALAERKDWVNSRKCDINSCSLQKEYILPPDAPRPTFASQCKSLAAAKKGIPELKLPHTHVLQQVLRALEAAFVAMWERGHGFPRFKKRMRSFVFPQLNTKPIQGEYLDLPKIGLVKFRMSRPIPDGFVLKQIRVVKRASGYYAMLSLQSDVEVPQPQPHGHGIGIDLGLQHFIATSDGELITRPRFFVDAQRKLKSLQRKLKRKKKGSRAWREVQRRVARQHERISNSRKDFHFKTAHHLCDNAGMLFAEDLNLKAMAAGMLCKHTLDAGFGQFLSILSHVCWKRDVYFAKVNASGTSQICPQCGTHTGKKDLSVRVHHCPECGYEKDRDIAAAEVVLQRGFNSAAGLVAVNSCGGQAAYVVPMKQGIPVLQDGWRMSIRTRTGRND